MYHEHIDEQLEKHQSRTFLHNVEFYEKIMGQRMLETLVNMFVYEFENNENSLVVLNSQELELLLRRGNHVAVGKDKNGVIRILGTISYNTAISMFNTIITTGKDITPLNNVKFDSNIVENIDFVVFHNKFFSTYSDIELIEYYCNQLAEVQKARMSLYNNMRVLSVIKTSEDAESVDNDYLTTSWVNGIPTIKSDQYFDKDDILQINTASDLSSGLERLKIEHNNIYAELLEHFGINMMTVEKASGVNEIEAKMGDDILNKRLAVYINPRLKAVENLRKILPTTIKLKFRGM